MKTTGSLDVYHIHPDFGMAGVNVLPVKVTWQDKYWLTTRTQKNIYFLSHKAFSRLQALKTSNLFEEGSHSPLRFPLSEGLDFPTTTRRCTVKYRTQYSRYTTESAKVKHVSSKRVTKRETTCVNSKCCLLWSKGSEPVVSHVFVCVCVCVKGGWRRCQQLQRWQRGRLPEGLWAWPAPTTHRHTLPPLLLKHPTLLANPVFFPLPCTPHLTHTQTLWPLRKGEGRLMQLAPLWALLCWWIEVVWWATRLLAAVPALLGPWIYKRPKWRHRWTLLFNGHHFLNK